MNQEVKKKHGIFWAIGVSILLQMVLAFVFAIVYLFTNNDALSYFFGYLITLVLLFIIYHKELINDLKNFKQDISGNIKKIIIVFVILIVGMYLSNIILYLLFSGIADNEQLVRTEIFKNPLLMFLPICIVGPIIEEITYRYPYKNIKTNKKVAFIIYSLIFALLHITVSNNLTDLLYIIPYFLLSASFGYAFYKTDNIYTSMIFHIINNTFTYILIIIGGQ